MQNPLRHLFAALFLTTAPALHAGHEIIDKNPEPVWSPFDKGVTELQIGAGYFHSFSDQGEAQPRTIDVGGIVRLGWMLDSPEGDGFFRGNFEFLVEAFGAGVVEGPSGWMGGATLLLRYNFVQPDATVVPYFQLGAGGLYNNIHENTPQRLFGGPFSFNLQGGLGVRIFCAEHCAIFTEVNYRHMSNANIYDRNSGLNSLGGYIGVSYFF